MRQRLSRNRPREDDSGVLRNTSTLQDIGTVTAINLPHRYSVIPSTARLVRANQPPQSLLAYLHSHPARKNLRLVGRHSFLLLSVQGTWIAIRITRKHTSSYEECNDAFSLISSSRAHWHTLEIEYRLTFASAPHVFVSSLHKTIRSHFTYGLPIRDVSTERYFRVRSPNGARYIITMPPNISLGYPANMKYTEPLYGRNPSISRYHILPHTPSTFAAAIGVLSQTQFPPSVIPLATITKRKTRVVAVDGRTGHIFGVSGHTVTLPHQSIHLQQLEIEYWSRLLPRGARSFPLNNTVLDRTLRSLVKSIRRYLTIRNIHFRAMGLTKAKWLESVLLRTSDR